VNGLVGYLEGDPDNYNLHTVTEHEFIDLLLAAGGRETPIAPTAGQDAYPLMRFLNITTENGTRYQVNPDRSVMQLSEDAPLVISPDGSHVAFRLDDDTIAFQYIWTDYAHSEIAIARIISSDSSEQSGVRGEWVRFSNDSNLVAIWDLQQLNIYMFSNALSGEGWFYGLGLVMFPVAQIEFTATMDTEPRVLWSADSSTIVWEDGSGIWRWDLVEDAAAQQIMRAEELEDYGYPALLDLSTWTCPTLVEGE
jgi:hypothetical protein